MLAWNCAKRADRGVPASPHASDSAHTLQGNTACAARTPHGGLAHGGVPVGALAYREGA